MYIWRSELLKESPNSNALFPAQINTLAGEKWGYINQFGKFVITPKFDYAFDFQANELAIVEYEGLNGIIDKKGKYIVRPQYRTITPFYEERAIVADETGYHVMDESGRLLTSKPYSYISTYEEGRAVFSETISGKYIYGYLDRQGKEIIPAAYQTANDFEGGTALVQISDEEFGLLNKQGKMVQTFRYPYVGSKGDGLLAFRKEQGGRFGYINEGGDIVIEPAFESAQPFQHGIAIVGKGETFPSVYGVIKKQGEFIVEPEYNDIKVVSDNRLALGKTKEGRPPNELWYALATLEGKVLTEFKFNIILDFEKGVASVSDGSRTFFINSSGNIVKNLPVVEGAGTLSFEGKLIRANIENRITYYDRSGNIVWKQDNTVTLNKQYRVLEKKYNPNPDYIVYYPEIQGMKNKSAQSEVNQRLMELSLVKPVPSDVALDSSYSGDFSISFYRQDLLVIEFEGYDYPFGAAHGMPYKAHAHINLKSGQMYELKDLFKADSEYVTVLSDIIREQIKNDETYSYVFPDAFKGIAPDQPFYVDDKALYLYFAPYEIGPYAAGFPTFKIPFEEIMAIINNEGEFWRSFHTYVRHDK
ncbi:WG repeat-containing protein [Bacillus sp. Marseille-P3661]|uniref:WG repeat-containing protein n=1 Tax=Bacillus sp. Marseille-P3661 TaxID=1936234 RepID=UPI000C85438F|nr:WG repeat-containing protein [Bacillus sp. Marseille-P3661]